MAKGPGPALFLAAAAAFMLMGKKKDTPPVVGGNGASIDPEGDLDVGGGPAGGGGTGGSGTGGAQSKKTVPNPSLDPKGYDTKRWQDGYDVRVGFAALGYLPTDALIEAPLTDPTARAAIKKFQKDFNAGDTTVELGQWAGEAVPGYLVEDKGVAGKNVLNALEIVIDGFPDGKWASYYN